MAWVRAVLNFMLAGALVGMLLGSYFGSQFLPWYNSPAGSATALCQCTETAQLVASQLIGYQLKGTAGGAGAGLAAGIGFMVWRRKRAAAKVAAGTTT